MTRTCKECLETKPLTLFVAQKSCKGGYRYLCKACRNAALASSGNHLLQSIKWNADPENKIKKRNYELKRKFNIDLATYNNMLEAQGGMCAICGTTSDKNFNVDHCHSTGAVRGLLCHNCNVALGLFKDNTAVLAQAISYLAAR